MNTIVKSNYPVSKVPENLRDEMDPSSTVTVTVTVEERPEKVMISRRNFRGEAATVPDEGSD